MHFDELKYLTWARQRERGTNFYSLFESGVSKISLAELRRMGFGLKDMEVAFTPEDTHGLVKLKEAVARHYKIKPSNITLTSGATMGTFLVSAFLAKPGDEVIVETPCYEPLLMTPRALGMRIKRLPRRFSNRFQLDPDELKKLLTRRVKAIYLTNLHNPSGVLMKPGLLRQIGRLAQKVGAYVVCNEVYLEFLLKKRPAPAFTLADNIITVTSLTKAYGLGGVRAGWILAHPRVTRQLHHVLDYVVARNSIPSERITLFALKHFNRLQARTRKVLSTNRPIIKDWMSRQEHLQWIQPDGGIISFPKLPQGINSIKFVDYLKRRYHTIVTPGEFFQAPGHIRLGFGSPPKMLREGLKRLNQALIKFHRSRMM